jgi:hypothetical protein
MIIHLFSCYFFLVVELGVQSTEQPESYYYITHNETGLVFDLENGVAQHGATIVLNMMTGVASQKWRYKDGYLECFLQTINKQTLSN